MQGEGSVSSGRGVMEGASLSFSLRPLTGLFCASIDVACTAALERRTLGGSHATQQPWGALQKGKLRSGGTGKSKFETEAQLPKGWELLQESGQPGGGGSCLMWRWDRSSSPGCSNSSALWGSPTEGVSLSSPTPSTPGVKDGTAGSLQGESVHPGLSLLSCGVVRRAPASIW